jgi:hypothetical protein
MHKHRLEGTGNVYWSYSGSDKMFVRYDFAKDHGIGNADHSDGSVWRYAVSGIRSIPNVPAHLFYAADSKLVYMTDPGSSTSRGEKPRRPSDLCSTYKARRFNVFGALVAARFL